MKKITLLTFLMATVLSFAQSSLPIDYENGTTTASFQFNGIAFANIANPDPSGINTSARVLEVNKDDNADWFAGFGYETPGSAFIDLANGEVFTMKVWAPIANQSIRFQIQIGLNNEPTYNRDVLITTPGVWTEVTFDFSNQPGLTGTEQYTTLVIQPNYDPACEGASCTTVGAGNGGIWYIDDIVQVGAPAPTCNDGIQNGQETGVDCGGPDCPPCQQSGPTTDAPETASTGTDLYVYSGLPGSAVTNFNFNAFSGGATITEVDIEGNGNNAGRIDGSGFFFYGAQWDPVDLVAGGYQFVHLNYYATTTTEFNFFLIDGTAGIPGGDPTEPRFRFGGATPDAPIVTDSWQSVFIPLQHFLDYTPSNPNFDLNDIFQWKFDGNGEVYFDNIFFSTTNSLSTDSFELSDFNVAPNPTQDRWVITTSNNQNLNSVVVFDILGKEVIRMTPNSNTIELNASNLKDGIYLARLTSANGTRTVKLVKN